MNNLHSRIEVGSTVMYSREWLHNTGQFTGEVPFMVGNVLSIESPCAGWELCNVRWVSYGEIDESKVLRKNLVRKCDLHLEAR